LYGLSSFLLAKRRLFRYTKERGAGDVHRILCSFFNSLKAFRPGLISVYAASATLFIVISFFPFMIVLLSCVRFIPITQDYFASIRLDFIPDQIRQLLMFTLQEVSQNTGTAVLPVAVLTTIWSASSGMLSLSKGLNIVYKAPETRRYVAVRAMCIGYTVAFIALILLVLICLVFGNQLLVWGSAFFPAVTELLLQIAYIPFLSTLILLIFFFTVLYRYVPNYHTKLRKEIPGACFSALGWLIFSKGYSLYISTISNYPAVYGSLTAVVFMIVWLYACIYIVFIGAYINRLIENRNRVPSA